MARSFSERMGYTPVKVDVQIESMDRDLKVGLWNCLYIFFFKKISDVVSFEYDNPTGIFSSLWAWHFKFTLDNLPREGWEYNRLVKAHYDSYSWNKVFDLIEDALRFSYDSETNKLFTEYCNAVLQEELAGYRLINNRITPIVSEEEIRAVEEAINGAPDRVRDHLESALERLSDRVEPDYRNSIKESISAVEALCKQITDKRKGTLEDALKVISNSEKVSLHPTLADAFRKLYAWTSSDAGIRHALMDEPNLDQEDAIFMLVSCSAFTNYLIVKADKAGIELRQ